MGLFGSSRPRFGAGIVATPEQEAETHRLTQQFGIGAPSMSPDLNVPTPVPMQQTATQQSQRWVDGGKFGGKDALGLALAAIGDVAAMQGGRQATGVSSLTQMRMGSQDLQRKMQLAQQQRMQEREDWQWKEQYKAANPGPADDVFTQSLRAAGIDPNSPEAQQLYRNRVTNMADPVVNIPLPGGQVYMGPRSQLPGAAGQAPTRPVGKLTPLTGGGAGNGASNFPSGNPLQRPW